MADPKWKKFEALTAKIQKDLAPNAKVVLNDKILGKKTGDQRQVDVSIRERVGQFDLLIAMECKDYNHPLDVKDVEEILGLFGDIEPNQGVIVSAKGFSSNALKRGKEAGLKLYRLVDTGDHDWKSNIAIPAFCTLYRLVSLSVTVRGTGRLILPADDNELMKLEMYDDNNAAIGIPKDAIYEKWIMGELPLVQGWQQNVDFIGHPVKIIVNGEEFNVEIFANLLIEKEMYFHYMPIIRSFWI